VRIRAYLVTFLFLALAGAISLAWQQSRELIALRSGMPGLKSRSALEAQLANLREQNRALQAEIAAWQARLGAGYGTVDSDEKEGSDIARDEAALFQRLATLVSADGGFGSRRDEDLELLAAMADLPEFQRMLALHQRGRVEEKYADLFKRLRLAPGDLARLQTLLGDRQGAFADAMMAARSQGLTGREARELAGQVARTTQKEITESINDLLGPEQFKRLQNYERTAPQRETVGQLAERLSYTTEPLTVRQQERLVQTLASTDLRKASRTANSTARAAGEPVTKTKAAPAAPIAALPGTVAGLGLGGGRSVAISSDAIVRAGTFLSPSQIAALQRMHQEQQAQQTIGNLLRNGTVTAPVRAPDAAKPVRTPKPGK
jgi:hypothetical protein